MDERMKNLTDEMKRKARELAFREGRLLSAEKTLRAATVWYACAALVMAVLGLIYPEKGFQPMSVLTTGALAILAVCMCVQKYAARAYQMRGARMRLERAISEAECADEAAARGLQDKYLEICASDEGMNRHEMRAVSRMHDLYERDGKRRLCGYEKFLYWFVEIAGIVVKTMAALAPIALTTLNAVGLL